MVLCTVETVRKAVSEAKGRAARAEAEAALQAAHVARLEAQLARLRARQDHQDEHEEQLKQERRKLQREVTCLLLITATSYFSILRDSIYFTSVPKSASYKGDMLCSYGKL